MGHYSFERAILAGNYAIRGIAELTSLAKMNGENIFVNADDGEGKQAWCYSYGLTADLANSGRTYAVAAREYRIHLQKTSCLARESGATARATFQVGGKRQ